MPDYDFSGYATRYNLKCKDGRVILPKAFAHQDAKKVPLVWQHQHNDPNNVLGYATLESKPDGMYAYGTFNNSPAAQQARYLIEHGDVDSLSIFANDLVEESLRVEHGHIRELSLVLAGANPGAIIDYVALQHDDGFNDTIYDDKAVIYTDMKIELCHASVDDGGKTMDKTVGDIFNTFSKEEKDAMAVVIALAFGEEPAGGDGQTTGKTIGDIINNMSEEKQNVFNYLVGQATADLEHSGVDDMTHINIFDNSYDENAFTLSHGDFETIVADAMQSGSLRDAFIRHAGTYGIDDISILMPDGYVDVNGMPEFIERDTTWVSHFMDGSKHSPMSRIKTRGADITTEQARAKGYVTGAEKEEQVFGLIKRVTTPTTVYVKQKLDRDDFVDITDFDVAVWMKGEMRGLLTEELARAALISDGRPVDSPDKIKTENIRPIYTDDDMYAHHIKIAANTPILDVIDTVTASRQYYKGSGSPTLYCTTVFLNEMLLKRDTEGRRIHKTVQELAAVLRVSDIVEVEVMDNVTRNDGVDNLELLGIIVNPKDYTFGADKGGKTTFFDDFDIDFNQLKYLYETRVSGALTKFKSAIVLEAVI